ncbi:MAG TPA: methyltransferase domain-containing protein [Candidatus Saccharimonadales bacterium]|nr:methyltransferase domain-containing protein [Candidatus Saccharimonadales bacterium]
MQSVLILGRQPELGLAELESLYGADKLRPIADGRAVIVDVDPCLLAFDRLGGSVKFCKLLTILDTTNWSKIEKFLLDVSPGHASTMPEGKMRLGLSVIGLPLKPKQLEVTGLKLKKAIRTTGRNVRLVPNNDLELNSAQVLHNQLTGPTGWELYFLRDGEKTVVVQTVKVQDITAYTRRDRERPKRDTKVGMLPPKLAQIILNLASGAIPEPQLQNICDIPAGQAVPRTILHQTVLDPFCGTGVVLQEALLMGYDVLGSDLEPRMVDYTQANLKWLGSFTADLPDSYTVEAGDATNYEWTNPVDLVASEVYLGRPFTSAPNAEILSQTVSECNLIIKKFLQNIHSQLKPGTRLCLAVPAWRTNGQFRHLPLIDSLSDLGYNRLSFEHLRDANLLYYREDQLVARELLVITRK